MRYTESSKARYINTPMIFVIVVSLFVISGCGGNSSNQSVPSTSIIVNSLLDDPTPEVGTITLRSAIEAASNGERITFDQSLNGETINLTIIDTDHTVLTGEVMGFDEANNISFLIGYHNRDYGKTALFAEKDVYIDASNLADGITINWDGADPARVMAVDGNLRLNNVSITGGHSVYGIAEDVGQHPQDEQTSTLARGAGLAVWGIASLSNCEVFGNHAEGDPSDSSRDGGAYGGGVYADTVLIDNCTISGNTVSGGGAAGGGVFVVGGRDTRAGTSTITHSTITENRITGLFAYGAGIYSDGGGIGMSTLIEIHNSTIARNLVEPPLLPPFLANLLDIGYWRGGGLYMSNGYMHVKSSTIVENQVFGKPRTNELGKPNLAGGIAATIGNAHAVEDMVIGHSIVVGNTVHEIESFGPSGYIIGNIYPHDIFSGSVFEFRSLGYNRIGILDLSQILVPIGEPNWASLSRKHYPQTGDLDGILIDDVIADVELSSSIVSSGVQTDATAVLYYTPTGNTLNQIPTSTYQLTEVLGELIGGSNEGRNTFLLPLLIEQIELEFGQPGFETQFRSYFHNYLSDINPAETGAQQYENCHGTTINTIEQIFWCGPAQTWPQMHYNHAYIEFWHHLDLVLNNQVPGVNVDQMQHLGPALINDDIWIELFGMGRSDFSGISINFSERTISIEPASTDQLNNNRSTNSLRDIGAIEVN